MIGPTEMHDRPYNAAFFHGDGLPGTLHLTNNLQSKDQPA